MKGEKKCVMYIFAQKIKKILPIQNCFSDFQELTLGVLRKHADSQGTSKYSHGIIPT